MRCLIRRRTESGSWNERAVEVPALTFGRGTQCTVELPGAMVALEHAALRAAAPGRYRLESAAIAGVEVHGVPGIRDCEVLPGDHLGIGEHEVLIEKPVGYHDLIVSVTSRRTSMETTRAEAAMSLSAAGLRLRAPILAAITIVLVIGLVLPLASRGVGAQWPDIAALSDAVWQPGPVSHGHAHFAQDCGRCHEHLLSPVDDATCAGCHAAVADHSAAAPVREHIAANGCMACHREHEGPHGIIATAPALCTNCHADVEAWASVAKLSPVTDFTDGHPEFSPGLADGGARSGLVFSHERHLRARGLPGPDGAEVLACRACHVAGAGDVEFAMPKFEDHCQRCHRLTVVAGGRETELPHGQNEAVLRLLELAGAARPEPAAVPPVLGLRQRAGASADRGTRDEPADRVTDVFEHQLCAGCHEIERVDNAPRVRAPSLHASNFAAAEFSHAPHGAVACDRCHAAATSTQATDALMPDIGNCRGCHAGAGATRGIPSPCATCHRFHRIETTRPVAGSAPAPG